MYRVRIRPAYTGCWLSDGKYYEGGQEAVLTDLQYDRLPVYAPTWFSEVVHTEDPVVPSVESSAAQPVQMAVIDDRLCWRSGEDDEWNVLLAVSSLYGPASTPGIPESPQDAQRSAEAPAELANIASVAMAGEALPPYLVTALAPIRIALNNLLAELKDKGLMSKD